MVNTFRNKIRLSLQEIFILSAAIALVASFALPAFATPNTVSLNLSDSRPQSGAAGTNVTYTLRLSNIANTPTGCVTVDLGATNDDASGATYSGSSTAFTTGWTDDSTTNQLKITNATPAAPNSTTNATLVWDGVDNGDTADTAYDATYTAYSDTACTTPIAGETVTVQYIFTAGQQVTASVDPSFSFTVAGVNGGVGETVNGATTTTGLNTTATTIPFGTVVASTNKIAAQDLTITTNAQNGFSIYLQSTGLLSNGSDTIPNHDGTQASPTAFPSGTGFEDFGYTTDDDDVGSGGSNPFDVGGSGNLWAGNEFNTQQNRVGFGAAAVGSGDTIRVGYQLGVATTTPSGNYASTIIYTAVPTY